MLSVLLWLLRRHVLRRGAVRHLPWPRRRWLLSRMGFAHWSGRCGTLPLIHEGWRPRLRPRRQQRREDFVGDHMGFDMRHHLLERADARGGHGRFLDGGGTSGAGAVTPEAVVLELAGAGAPSGAERGESRRRPSAGPDASTTTSAFCAGVVREADGLVAMPDSTSNTLSAWCRAESGGASSIAAAISGDCSGAGDEGDCRASSAGPAIRSSKNWTSAKDSRIPRSFVPRASLDRTQSRLRNAPEAYQAASGVKGTLEPLLHCCSGDAVVAVAAMPECDARRSSAGEAIEWGR